MVRNKEFKFWQDWDRYEGMFAYKNDKTIHHYRELIGEFGTNKKHPAHIVMEDPANGFYAFTNEDFEKCYNAMKPHLKEGEKVISAGGGIYFSPEGLKKYRDALREVENKVREECDPQEVYVHEFNNHECVIDWDGDEKAIEIVKDYFGLEVAKSIKRVCAFHSIG